MNSEKVKDIKKAIQETIDGKLSTEYLTVCEISCCPILNIDKLFLDILTLINELESEKDKYKNLYETVYRKYVKLEAETYTKEDVAEFKDRIAKLEKELETRKAEVLHMQEYGKKLIKETELKQFVERLIEKAKKGSYIDKRTHANLTDFIIDIDETLKEFINVDK